MPGDEIQVGSPRDWLRNAQSDLALAGMRKTRTVLYAHLCFHSQQAAEKAVKAVLLAQGVRFARTHDLAYLLDLIPSDVGVPLALVGLPTLTKYAVQQRYPGAALSVTRKHHQQSLRLARYAVAWAATRLDQAP